MGYGPGGCKRQNWGVTNGKMLAFVGVEVMLPIIGPTDANVKGPLESAMVLKGGDAFDVICIEEAVC